MADAVHFREEGGWRGILTVAVEVDVNRSLQLVQTFVFVSLVQWGDKGEQKRLVISIMFKKLHKFLLGCVMFHGVIFAIPVTVHVLVSGCEGFHGAFLLFTF